METSKAVSGLRLKIIGKNVMDKLTLLLRSVSPTELLAIQQILCFSENHTMRLTKSWHRNLSLSECSYQVFQGN